MTGLERTDTLDHSPTESQPRLIGAEVVRWSENATEFRYLNGLFGDGKKIIDKVLRAIDPQPSYAGSAHNIGLAFRREIDRAFNRRFDLLVVKVRQIGLPLSEVDLDNLPEDAKQKAIEEQLAIPRLILDSD